MNKLALKVVSGDFDQGFPIILRQGENLEIEGNLPAAPNLPQDYETWKLNYYNRPGINHFRSLKIPDVQTTNYSNSDLKNSINTWLNSDKPEFRRLRDKLLGYIPQNNQKEIIIQTDDVWFWRIPWHLWDVLEENKIEVILSASQYEKIPQQRKTKPKNEVRILVILGDSTNINVQSDLLLLQNELPKAYIQPLLQPSKEQVRKELWEQEWDILFFAGHSYSQGGNIPGEFQINPQEKLTIEELKHGLENAIKNGLQLAIFNSCDCIGLARELVKLQLPATIVMREEVLDIVAQKFLEYFLKAFTKEGATLSTSVREARERLRELEDKYFCASMLPLICHNPATEMPTWKSLLGELNANQAEKKENLKNDNSYEQANLEIGLQVYLNTVDRAISYIEKNPFKVVSILGLVILSFILLPISIADYLNRVAVSKYYQGQSEIAGLLWKWSKKINPNNSSVYNNQGVAYQDRGFRNKAYPLLEQACQRNNSTGCVNFARLLNYQDGDPEQIEALYHQALKEVKDEEQEYFVRKNWGIFQFGQNRFEEAKYNLTTATQLVENPAEAYCYLAELLERENDKSEALEISYKCLGHLSQEHPNASQLKVKAEKVINRLENTIKMP
ncbi:MAG: CHAT domain-containing protein [Oscillatoria sp. PMC 1068.18]|nr:CHAT domain-containing protein [Oscillatoria sp. PMC 1076.18]MEC4988516.1 CHAT domain-containing protein [Oscillatoria sp. PMC 1068.18]